jgi:hypothetical protein
MTNSKRGVLLYAYIVAVGVTFTAFLALLVAEAYVRWTLNQEFSFLGGAGLQTLAILLFGQFAGLAYIIKD